VAADLGDELLHQEQAPTAAVSAGGSGSDDWSVAPAAHERLKQAAVAMPPGTPAPPFIDALTELVQALEAVVFPDLRSASSLVRHMGGDSVGVVACCVSLPARSRMPSVVGLLEQHELAARCRVDTVLAPDGASTADTEDVPDPWDAGVSSAPRDSAKPKSQVPVRREGLSRSVLSVDYQRILKALADRLRLGQGPLTCQEMAAAFGMEVVLARVEALRSKAKRLVARGWPAEPAPGRFTLAGGVAGSGRGA
jgi:hypothetical protein